MNRYLAGTLFVLASLVGGPIIFLAASVAVVNLIRGALLLLRAFLDFNDFTFLINAVPFVIAVAIMYGIYLGLQWLALRTVGGSSIYDRPEGREQIYLRARIWTTSLITLLVVALLFTGIVSLWLNQQPPDDLWSLILDRSSFELAALGIALAAYMPIAAATHTMATVGLEAAPSDAKQPWSLWIGWTLPPVVLVIWLIIQGITGGLF